MAAFNKFYPFVGDIVSEIHNLGSDALKLAFCSTSAAPTATSGQLSDLTVLATAGFDSIALTTSSSAVTATGMYKLKLADKTVTAQTNVAFGHVVIWNDTAPADELIGWYNYGSQLSLTTGESLAISFTTSQVLLTIV